MKARKENDRINVYGSENKCIGFLKPNSNFKRVEVFFQGRELLLLRKKWTTDLIENNHTILQLKMNSLSGEVKIPETGQKIEGVAGLIGGTKLVDRFNRTLLKIKNQSQWIDHKRYEIDVLNQEVTELEILITLYSHLSSSKMKLLAVIIGAVAAVIIMRVVFNNHIP